MTRWTPDAAGDVLVEAARAPSAGGPPEWRTVCKLAALGDGAHRIVWLYPHPPVLALLGVPPGPLPRLKRRIREALASSGR